MLSTNTSTTWAIKEKKQFHSLARGKFIITAYSALINWKKKNKKNIAHIELRIDCGTSFHRSSRPWARNAIDAAISQELIAGVIYIYILPLYIYRRINSALLHSTAFGNDRCNHPRQLTFDSRPWDIHLPHSCRSFQSNLRVHICALYTCYTPISRSCLIPFLLYLLRIFIYFFFSISSWFSGALNISRDSLSLSWFFFLWQSSIASYGANQ